MGEGWLMENKKDVFILKDGSRISSLKELRNFLIQEPGAVFNYHVTLQKNDFENWIRHSLNIPELANLVHREKTPEGIARVIDSFLSEKNLEGPEKKSLTKEIRMKETKRIPELSLSETSKISEVPQEVKIPTLISEIKEGANGEKIKEELKGRTEEETKDEIPPIQRIKIGVPGFDELITDGIPHGSSVLISGGPGTGKTTFCLQLLKDAAEKGESCLYLTFEEDVSRLKQHMKNYGWDPDKLEKEGKLLIKKMRPFDLSRSVEALLARASGELTIELDEIEGIIPKGFKPDRIVLDSLSAVAAAFIGKEEGYRIYIEQLFNLFKGVGATSFLITEIEQETSKYSRTGIEEFLADAVFVFYNIRQKNTRLNALEILKIRGTLHQKKIVPFRILSNQGIVVYPREEVFT